MSYNPDRDARVPADIDPHERPYGRSGAGVGVALILGLMAAFVAVGFWFYATHSDANLATDERPAAEQTTTGSGSQERPLPETPTPPTVPSPQRQ